MQPIRADCKQDVWNQPQSHTTHTHISWHALTPNIKCWKIQKATCGVLKTACPCSLGQGGPSHPLRCQCFVTAGKKGTQKHMQTDTIHTHTNTIVFRLYADCLSHYTTDWQLCRYTHTHSTHCLNRNTSDASEGEWHAHLFDQFNRLPSWVPNHADFFFW